MTRYRAARYRFKLRMKLLGGASAFAVAVALGLPIDAYAQDGGGWIEAGGGYDNYKPGEDSNLPEGSELDGSSPADHGSQGFIAGAFQGAGSPYIFSGQVIYGRSSTENFSTSYSTSKYSAQATTEQDEHYLLADIKVGRDIGLGGSTTGTVSLGVRYASYQADSRIAFATSSKYGGGSSAGLKGTTAISLPGGNDYSAAGTVSREFTGFGPVLALHVDSPFSGRMGEWGFSFVADVSVAVLFGDAKTDFTLTTVPGGGGPTDRSDSHTVTDIGLALALAWRSGNSPIRIKVGYRAEMLADVLDGGFSGANDVSRYVDGPFASLVWTFH